MLTALNIVMPGLSSAERQASFVNLHAFAQTFDLAAFFAQNPVMRLRYLTTMLQFTRLNAVQLAVALDKGRPQKRPC